MVKESEKPLVAIIMGSKSDWPTMTVTAETLDEFGVAFETKIVSAHRTPDLLFEFAKSAEARGIEEISERSRFASFDRPNARRHSGRNAGNRHGRGKECCAPSNLDPRKLAARAT
jgi:hypothetical protein